ncbi:MAG: hypothetical protein II612_04450, partial [Prevotella sp.]|nr:hypothetical protein [Prevotella sp.]
MINLSELNSFPGQDSSLALLKEIAQKYCPERLRVGELSSGMEWQNARRQVLPDDKLLSAGQWLGEPLNLDALKAGFEQLLAGGSGFEQLPYVDDAEVTPRTLPQEDGFGIGIPE